MLYATLINGIPTLLSGAFKLPQMVDTLVQTGTDENGVPEYENKQVRDTLQYPDGWLISATPADLVAHSIVSAYEPAINAAPGFQFNGTYSVSYQNGAFAFEPNYENIPVPDFVSMTQAKLALNAAGKLTAVTNYMATASIAQQIEWNTSVNISRTNPLVTGIGQLLGMSDSDIDALFIQAAAIVP